MGQKFQGKKFSCETVTKKLPDGRYVDVDIVTHPGAVLIIPFSKKDTIVFVRQYRPVFERYLLELPAGTLEKGERAFRCAQRELIEETGYNASVFTRIGDIYPVPGYSTEIIHIFKAEKLIPEEGLKDEDELIEIKVFKKREIKKLFSLGRIKDAKTIAALSFCGWLF